MILHDLLSPAVVVLSPAVAVLSPTVVVLSPTVAVLSPTVAVLSPTVVVQQGWLLRRYHYVSRLLVSLDCYCFLAR